MSRKNAYKPTICCSQEGREAKGEKILKIKEQVQYRDKGVLSQKYIRKERKEGERGGRRQK